MKIGDSAMLNSFIKMKHSIPSILLGGIIFLIMNQYLKPAEKTIITFYIILSIVAGFAIINTLLFTMRIIGFILDQIYRFISVLRLSKNAKKLLKKSKAEHTSTITVGKHQNETEINEMIEIKLIKPISWSDSHSDYSICSKYKWMVKLLVF